jgi:DNA-binding response OmpR family regulator
MTHKTSILIVDDDNDLRKLLRLALDNGKRVIHEADTALGGLQLARKLSPDILLLDIGLPGNFDGFVLYQAMSREAALWHVRTVIISGHGALEDLTQAERLGVDAYVIKPFSPAKLVEVVERLENLPREMLVIDADPAAADKVGKAALRV